MPDAMPNLFRIRRLVNRWAVSPGISRKQGLSLRLEPGGWAILFDPR